MTIPVEKYLRYLEQERIRMGFKDDWEQFAVTMNWKEVFGEDLPDNYYHPRDYKKLEAAMIGLAIHEERDNLRRN